MTDYLAFTVTAILLALTPGPDILLVVATAARTGFKQAMRFTMGLASGVIVHTLLIVFGISALIAGSPLMVKLIGLFGACYLFYLAVRIFIGMRQQAASENNQTIEGSYYWRGVIMNITNPKVLLFFLALFPQFANLNAPGYQMRIVILGIIFQLVTLVVFGGTAWLTAKSSAGWMRDGRYRNAMDWINIVIFVVIGVLLLFNSLR